MGGIGRIGDVRQIGRILGRGELRRAGRGDSGVDDREGDCAMCSVRDG